MDPNKINVEQLLTIIGEQAVQIRLFANHITMLEKQLVTASSKAINPGYPEEDHSKLDLIA